MTDYVTYATNHSRPWMDLVEQYGVPEPIAFELLQWAKDQEIRIHPSCSDNRRDREKDYQRARLLINRVKDLGYKKSAA